MIEKALYSLILDPPVSQLPIDQWFVAIYNSDMETMEKLNKAASNSDLSHHSLNHLTRHTLTPTEWSYPSRRQSATRNSTRNKRLLPGRDREAPAAPSQILLRGFWPSLCLSLHAKGSHQLARRQGPPQPPQSSN